MWSRCGSDVLLTPCIAFQQIEIEESIEPKHGPTLRLFGVTQNGNSVLAHVHGFKPYFYIAAPSGFLSQDLESLKDTINVSYHPQAFLCLMITKVVCHCIYTSCHELCRLQSQISVGLSW